MTDTFARTGRPPGAAIAWAAKDGIYVEFPTKEGHPFIARYKRNAEGLQSALNILLELPAESPPKPTKNHPAIRRAKPQATEEIRAEAAAIVRKLLLK